ncbi:unnamed protein product, partial [Mesorhabditis belari]|uniref:Integrator complex subunit 1 R3 domain-containing protein n=1 Tax=Mesorhabditis belari TaxID=2138241 RepID=A0AAF3EP51_9BILA
MLQSLHSCKWSLWHAWNSLKVLKDAQPPPVVAGILQNFASTIATAKKTQKVQLNNADDVLKQLQEKDDINNAERSRLVAYFLQFRPEIVDGGKHMMEQAEALFLSKNQTVVWLCSQLPQHCLPETMVSVLAFLLSSFNSKLNPSSVLSFLSFCANSGNGLAFKKANDAQLNVLAQYLCAAVLVDTKFDELAVSIVVAVETSVGSRVLRPIIETCIREAGLGLALVKQEPIKRLISNVNERYPCLQVDMINGLALLSFVNWRADESDNKATQLLTGAFSAANPENAKKMVDQLETLLRVYPKIIERQIGMLSRLLAQLVSMNSRNVKERMSLVAFSIRVLYQLIPVAEQGTLEHIDALISVLISFAERHLLEKRQTINETILRTCLRYLDSHQTRAQALLSEHPETILKLCDGIADRYFVEQIQAAVRGARTN